MVVAKVCVKDVDGFDKHRRQQSLLGCSWMVLCDGRLGGGKVDRIAAFGLRCFLVVTYVA